MVCAASGAGSIGDAGARAGGARAGGACVSAGGEFELRSFTLKTYRSCTLG